MADTLKPCPFCSGEAERCQNTDPHLPTWMFWVLCKSCHASPGDRKSRADADAAWNNCTIDDAPDARPDVVERLWLATKHGDNDHRAWLREAFTAFFAGEPVPEPRGRGNKEARITELEAQVAALSQPMREVEAMREAQIWNDAIECAATVAEHNDRDEIASAIRQQLAALAPKEDE